MNIKMEKVFIVHAHDYHRNVLDIEAKLTIQSLEETETYLSDSPGTMKLTHKQKETTIFVIESNKKDIPIPEYVNDAVMVSSAENLAFQFQKQHDTVISPFTSVCTIDDFVLDEEAMKTVMEMAVEMIEVYWDSVEGGIYEP